MMNHVIDFMVNNWWAGWIVGGVLGHSTTSLYWKKRWEHHNAVEYLCNHKMKADKDS